MKRRVFLGHQSVGADIIRGLRELADERGERLDIAPARDPRRAPGATFYESFVGENGDPASKLREFREVLDGGMGDAVDIALVKFCYADFSAATDPAVVFQAYVSELAALRRRHPALMLVHVTVPLVAREPLVKRLVKRPLRRPTSLQLNGVRSRYNRLLRTTFLGREPVFDLARIESTHPDGRRCVHSAPDGAIESLVPPFTDDGGHLNALGRKTAAAGLLDLLATL